MAAARKAFKHSSWKGLSGTDRGILMNKLADLVEKNADVLATVECVDNGKPYITALNEDVQEVAGVMRYYAGFADKNFGQVIDAGPNKFAYTLKQPLGVCAQIIPWNYPLAMAGWKLGPALCCGNTVVLKLAEQTPLSALVLGKLIKEAGFPPGVINIINGHGRVSNPIHGRYSVELCANALTGGRSRACQALGCRQGGLHWLYRDRQGDYEDGIRHPEEHHP